MMLRDIHDVLQVYRDIVITSFGPNGFEKLIFHPPKSPLMTLDGYSLLNFTSHPKKENSISLLLKKQLQNIHQHTGDGICSYIIMMHRIFYQIKDEILYNHLSQVKMIAAWREIRIHWLDQWILPHLNNIAIDYPFNRSNVFNLVQTVLYGSFSKKKQDFIATLIVDWVFSCLQLFQNAHNNDNKKNLDLTEFSVALLQSLPSCVVQIPCAVLGHSKVLKERFIVSNAKFMRKCFTFAHSPIKFVVVDGCIEPKLPMLTDDLYLMIKSNGELLHAMNANRQSISTMANFLKSVDLVLATGTIDQILCEQLFRMNILAVQCISNEDALVLCQQASIELLHADSLTFVKDSEIGKASNISETTINGKNYVYIDKIQKLDDPTNSRNQNGGFFQLLLRGSTVGICHELYLSVMKSVRLLSCWMSNDYNEYRLKCVPGAGAVEFFLYKTFHQVKENIQKKDATEEELFYLFKAFQILGNACIEIPETLLMNSRSSLSPSRDFSKKPIQDFLNDLTTYFQEDCDHPLGYISSMRILHTGNNTSIEIPTRISLKNPYDSNIVHPFVLYSRRLRDVLLHVEQFLRIECVLYTNR